MKRVLLVAMIFFIPFLLTGCNSSTSKQLSVASQVVAHALATTQAAVTVATQSGTISASENQALQGYFAQVATAGLSLDSAIRTNQSQTAIAVQLNTFLAAFSSLISQGVGNISNANTRLTITAALAAAEDAIAIIASVVGSSSTTVPTLTTAPAAKPVAFNYRPVVTPASECSFSDSLAARNGCERYIVFTEAF